MGAGVSDQPQTNPHYTLATWGGYPQWKCNHCAWDTLEGEGVMIQHIYQRHKDLFAPIPTPAQAGKKKKHKRS
jgi:hypothetical protein